MTPAARAQALLEGAWWRSSPGLLARLLQPLAWIYGAISGWRQHHTRVRQAPVPVLVVGNFIVGGAGKTPTVIALASALRNAGWQPGVISRGHGRHGDAVLAVTDDGDPAIMGDEPLLIRRRTGAPVFVGRDRPAAARALCAAHPQVDVIVADDGLQHHALARQAELVVFDDRGVGNGLLLPAGPLRQPLPARLRDRMRVLYSGARASTTLPGFVATRSASLAWALPDWVIGEGRNAVDLAALRGRRLLAVAGLAAPAKFFDMLEEAGLQIERLPLPDHHAYTQLPWPADTAEVITTEKDAVKLARHTLGGTRVWVVPLDLQLPVALIGELTALLSFKGTHEP